ncbi:hypothetical protein ALPO108162_11475 [Alicyclobacillus pomorum]
MSLTVFLNQFIQSVPYCVLIRIHKLLDALFGNRKTQLTACIIDMRGLYALIRQTIKRPYVRGVLLGSYLSTEREKNEEQYKNHEKRNFSTTYAKGHSVSPPYKPKLI